ncbi:MAG: hypothetical protein QW767_05365 [Thermoprotei archaeon]
MVDSRETKAERETERIEKGLFEGLIEALADKHGQLDIRLDDLVLRLPGLNQGFEFSGNISLSMHMRDLSDDEKKAHAERTVALLKS